MKRNRERVANLGAPSQNSAISLPFLVVNTSKKTTIDCSISSDKYATHCVHECVCLRVCVWGSHIREKEAKINIHCKPSEKGKHVLYQGEKMTYMYMYMYSIWVTSIFTSRPV